MDLGNELRYLSEIRIVSFDEANRTVEVELLPIGRWRKPQGGGWFEVTKDDLAQFVANFKSEMVGKELPLDFGHEPDSRRTPGWIVDMYCRPNANNSTSIFAKLQITEPETWERIKQKSLKYISPQINYGWVEPRSNKKYDIIRSAALTNYPYLKGMEPMKILNFEEVKKREEGNKEVKFDKFMTKLDEILAEELDEKEQEKKLHALFEEYGLKLEDGEDAKEKAKAEKERIEAEEKEKAEKDKKEKERIEAEEKRNKEDAEKIAAEKARLKKLTDERTVELEEEKKELSNRIEKLEERLESEKVDKMISGYKRAGKLLPALAPIVKAILMKGKSYVLNFEDKDTNVRDLVVRYFEEAPKVIDFEEVAAQELEKESIKSLDRMSQEEINAEAEKIVKDEGIRFEEAMDKVAEKHFKAPK